MGDNQPQEQPQDPAEEAGIKVWWNTKEASGTDIIAIHGIRGARDSSWTAQNGCNWLKDLVSETYTQTRISTWGYISDETSTLMGLAEGLLTDITSIRPNQSGQWIRPIIFIAHGVGGNILKQALLLARTSDAIEKRDIYLSVTSILFFGTRHTGSYVDQSQSYLANLFWKWIWLGDGSLTLLADPNIELSNRLFRPMASLFDIACFFEQRPTAGGFVVPSSAATLPDSDKIPLNSDHSGMIKFSSKENNNYVRVLSKLNEMHGRRLNYLGRPKPPASKISEDGLRILALDGGGVRGLSSLLILRSLMYSIQKDQGLKDLPRPCEYFDVICGTSTGGLIAIMLGRLRMDVVSCIVAYEKLSREVFELKSWFMWWTGAYNWSKGDGWFSAQALENAVANVLEHRLPLAEQEVLGDLFKRASLLDPNEDATKIFVCAVDTDTHDCVRLRSYATDKTKADDPLDNCTILEAARATAAAPTYFPHAEIGPKTFFDGAMKNNNPILELVKEVRGPLGNPNIRCIVSVGTGKSERAPYQASLLGLAKTLVRLAVDTESKHEEIMRDQAYKDIREGYLRFNVESGLGDVDLSRWDMLHKIKSSTLESLADHETELRIKKAAALLAAKAS